MQFPPTDPYRALRPLAAAQDGVVSREQALGHGMSARTVERLVRQGHWRRLATGIYLTADLAPGFEARAWAGVLLGGDGSCVGAEGAARLHGLTDVEPAVVPVLVPHGRKVVARPGWTFTQVSRPLVGRGAPPRTDVEDTVLDLCASARPEDAVGWVTLAVQRRRTTARRLRRALDARARHPCRALLEGLLTDVAVGAQSPLEVTYLRDVERAHGLSALVRRQQPSREHRAVRDVWYVDFGVVVELDGRLGHAELGRFRDMDRDNRAGLDGLLTLRYGSVDLHGRPCSIASEVARALRQRGWEGLPRRCARCVSVPDPDWR